MPQTGGLTQQKSLCLQFWSLKAQDEDASGVGFGEASLHGLQTPLLPAGLSLDFSSAP